jgi:hypothetical protein
MASEPEPHVSEGRAGTLLALVLSVGLVAVWNALTFATLTKDNSVMGRGPHPHTLHERFLILWFIVGVVWLIALISAIRERAWFRMAVSLTALVVCVLAWVINAIGWVQCVSAV